MGFAFVGKNEAGFCLTVGDLGWIMDLKWSESGFRLGQ